MHYSKSVDNIDVICEQGILMEIGERCNHHFYRALDLADNYPDLAFLECRRIIEIMIKDIYCEKMGVDSVPRKLQTIELIKSDLGHNNLKLPRVVDICMSLVQQLGNFGAHDQGGAEMEIDRLFMQACIVSTRALIEWRYPMIVIDDNPLKLDLLTTELIEHNIEFDTESNSQKETNLQNDKVEQTQTTIRVRLREFVEQSYKLGDEFKIGELKHYFGMLNPNNSPNAIHGHITMMTTNLPSRLSHKPKKDGSDDLLFRVRKGIYRRYDNNIDPEPIMPQNLAEQEWTSRLLILNASKSLDPVKNSRCYLSPDTGGAYKYPRAAFVGLYKDKAVRYVGEIIGKVVQETKDSEPYLDWLNDEEIPEDTLTELALEQINQRWDTVHPVKALIFGQLFPVEFKKDTKGGMFRNNLSLSVEKLNHTSGEELAKSLAGLVYSNLNE